MIQYTRIATPIPITIITATTIPMDIYWLQTYVLFYIFYFISQENSHYFKPKILLEMT